MSFGKIMTYFLATVLVVVVVFAILLVRSCNKGELYQAGSGIGSLVDIDDEKYQSRYIEKYADSFFKYYPQYKPSAAQLNNMNSGNDVLNLTNIYFAEHPREIYGVQWEGTGFTSVRAAFDCERNRSIVENVRLDATVPGTEKERMTKRFRSEVLDKIDALIAKSKDSSIAIWKSPF